MARLVVYVDGFNLYHGLHDRWGRRYLWLDLVKLAGLVPPRDEAVAVKYFTAPVLDDLGSLNRQMTYIDALSACYAGTFSVTYGRYQRRHMRCRHCGSRWISYEEKETDVNLATEVVADASAGGLDSALIISGDSDIAPAVRRARALRPELFVAAAFPPRRTSFELRELMPASFTIGPGRIKAAQLPDEVVVGEHTYKRPAHWR